MNCKRCYRKCARVFSHLRIVDFCAVCSEMMFDISEDRGKQMRFTEKRPPPKDERERILDGYRFTWWRGQWRLG
jgi:hypothetical protein